MIKTKNYTYWKSRLLEEAKLYKSLKFMENHLTFGIGLVDFFENAALSDCSI
jgi:hypothetical protein